MRAAILGAGPVGRSLARGMTAGGVDLVMGARRASDEPTSDESPAPILTYRDALDGADVVFLALPFRAVSEVAGALGGLDGRIVVDLTNPIGPEGFFVPPEGSGGEAVSALIPRARVVKAFNTLGAEIMVSPRRYRPSPVLPVAGDDAQAKGVIIDPAQSIGFDAVDAGPLANSAALEQFGKLWIGLATGGLGRTIAFALHRGPTAAAPP